MTATHSKIDFEKFRLRTFVDRLIDMGEVEIHDEAVPLTALGSIIEKTEKAVLFKKAGPEGAEIVAKTGGQPEAAARGVRHHRGQNLRRVFQAARQSAEGRRGAVRRRAGPRGEDHRQGRRPHQAAVLSAPRLRRQLLSVVGHRLRDRSGDRPPQRRLPAAEPSQPHECGTNVTAPSDLKRIYTACVARGEKLPITFTSGSHPLDFFAATMRTPGDELAMVATMRGETAAVVKSLTNDILVPADAEMTLEGYLDERGYVEPEGPVRRIHGLLRRDPHGPGVPPAPPSPCARTCCTTRCSTASPSTCTRPTARTSARSAPRRRRCAS